MCSTSASSASSLTLFIIIFIFTSGTMEVLPAPARQHSIREPEPRIPIHCPHVKNDGGAPVEHFFIFTFFYFMGRRIPMHCPLDFKSKMIKVRLLNIFTFFF